MLEYHPEEKPESGYVAVQAEQANETAFCATSNEEIEDYLDQIIAPLVRVMPRSKRTAIRAHVNAQLAASIAANRELGESHASAVRAAIRQSGDPELISQRWVLDTHIQTDRQPQRQIFLQNNSLIKPPSARTATLIAFGLFGLPYLADVTTWAGKYWATHSDNTITYYRFFLFSVPLLAGLATGLVARHRPVRGVLNALGLLCIPAIVLPGLLVGLSYAHLIDQSLQFPLNPLPGLCGLAPWTLLGCLGAVIGSKLKTRAGTLTTHLRRSGFMRRG
jgi:hypothetical protein